MTAATVTTNGKAPKAPAKAPAQSSAVNTLSVPALRKECILVPIIGSSPLITHRFSEKAKRQMLDAMQGRKAPKEPKDPVAEFEAAKYKLDDGRQGFPATGFSGRWSTRRAISTSR